MKKLLKFSPVVIIAVIAIVLSCEDRSINLFSLDQDMQFGEVMDSTIKANPGEYPILDEATHPEAYNYMNNMMDDLLKSEKFKYANDFDWDITIIDKDVMNAFAVPGGRMYFYTGLLKYLDNGAAIAGVLGHEMAHIDLRHSTRSMTSQYGFSVLTSLLLGDDSSQLAKIAADLATGVGVLQFSQSNEKDADKYAMYYTSTTKYNPKGIGRFFEKLSADNDDDNPFPFLSTHPTDEVRLKQIDEIWDKDEFVVNNKSGRTYDDYSTEYSNFLDSLK